jgi:hypothetical protein
MLEGAATARFRENSTAMNPGSTTMAFFIVGLHTAGYPCLRDIAIVVPLCSQLACQK